MKANKNILVALLLSTFFSCSDINTKNDTKENSKTFGLVIHGGAGSMEKGNYSEEQIIEYETVLNNALSKGYSALENNESALDAIEKVIVVLEDSPLFNAGRGAVFTNNETNELDAAIMDGSNLNAGAVAGITTVKNPIKLARAIMENSQHVMMIGEGAESFAKTQNIEIVNPNYFKTEERLKTLHRIKNSEKKNEQSLLNNNDSKFGTVGCVALDKKGNLASGTSTGGMTNKKFGRVGDVPIIGAGTYANNKTAALSATGHGEFFIRNVVTHDISALIEYKNMSLEDATIELVMNKLVKQNGDGGVIGIDRNGSITMTFNTKGMFRGYKTSDGKSVVKIFGN